jgi:hypothetical protein
MTQGLPGKQGQPGKPGNPGNPGNPGVTGKPGNTGTPGKSGQDGQDGNPGIPGKPGIAGKPGQDGKKGNPGLPGQEGKKGDPGLPAVYKGYNVINKLLKPSTIHYTGPVDNLRRLNNSSYNLYAEDGWILKRDIVVFDSVTNSNITIKGGKLKLPVKKCTQLDDIKSIMVNFYTISSAKFDLKLVLDTSSVDYSHNLLPEGNKYHATSNYSDCQHAEQLVYLQGNNDGIHCEEVKEITIEMNTGTIIISSFTIVYKNSSVNYFFCN